MAVISYSNVKYINICKKFIASAQSEMKMVHKVSCVTNNWQFNQSD